MSDMQVSASASQSMRTSRAQRRQTRVAACMRHLLVASAALARAPHRAAATASSAMCKVIASHCPDMKGTAMSMVISGHQCFRKVFQGSVLDHIAMRGGCLLKTGCAQIQLQRSVHDSKQQCYDTMAYGIRMRLWQADVCLSQRQMKPCGRM